MAEEGKRLMMRVLSGLLVLPYVSLVTEKSLALEQFSNALGFRIEVSLHSQLDTQLHAQSCMLSSGF